MNGIAPIPHTAAEAVLAPTPRAGALPRVAPGTGGVTGTPTEGVASPAEAAAQPARTAHDAAALQRQLDQTLAQARAPTALRFRVDQDARRIVVSVVDAESGETLRQIPDDTALALARRLADTGTGLLSDEA
ncbi:flagellar protein FlaG [Lysobacter olei]